MVFTALVRYGAPNIVGVYCERVSVRASSARRARASILAFARGRGTGVKLGVITRGF